jgi:prepilin-type N-terminal cleavage/methylation domain-containing protein
MNKRVRGFTIVELLIVIVVIAILAAITVVAYNGIKQRADNSARVAAAKEWYKVFHAYLAQNSVYPDETSDRHFCLAYGYATNLDATASNEDCFMASSVKHPSAVPLTALRIAASFPAYPAGWRVQVAPRHTWGLVCGHTIRLLMMRMWFWMQNTGSCTFGSMALTSTVCCDLWLYRGQRQVPGR